MFALVMTCSAAGAIMREEHKASPMAQSDQVVERALRFMGENYHRADLQLKEVAAAASVSSSHLAQLLRTRTGAGFIRHLTTLRIEAAKRMLADTDLHVNDIAIRSGYEGSGYFYRVFRREVGMTPSEYRRHVQEAAGR
jgi:two-component system response regulator YesN